MPQLQPARPQASTISTVLALTLVAAALIIGAFLIVREITPPKPAVHSTTINPTTDASIQPAAFTPPKTFVDPIPANFDKKVFTLTAPDGVRKTSDNSWSIKGGRLFMQVHRDRAGKFVIRYVYPYEEFLPRDTIAMLRTRWIMTETHKLMDDLKITAEQWEKLNAVVPNTDTELILEDQQRMRALLLAAVMNKQLDGGSARLIAEEELADAVRDLDQKYYEPTIARANRIAEEVKAIFTDLQYTGLMRRYSTW